MDLQLYFSELSKILIRLGLSSEDADLVAMILPFVGLTLIVLLFAKLLISIRRRRAKSKDAEAAVGKGLPEENKVDLDSKGEKIATKEEDLSIATTEVTADDVPAKVAPEERLDSASLFQKLRQGLSKTRASFLGRFNQLVSNHAAADNAFLEELEEILITADFGMQATQELVTTLKNRLQKDDFDNPKALQALLSEEIRLRLSSGVCEWPPSGPSPIVIMVVGVNGVGKTTTIGKLAKQFAEEGKKVILGAGDTFRAAAAEQLGIWGERAGAEVIRQVEGSDPAAVAFDAAKAAVARKADVLILDTAGRLHTKLNLMEELKKVRRVISREIPGAPHETLLVLDATTGQNALIQAKMFQEAVDVSGIALTKLDGTAKGGIVVAISTQLGLPVKLIGIGEGVSDLRQFDPGEFVEALFTNS